MSVCSASRAASDVVAPFGHAQHRQRSDRREPRASAARACGSSLARLASSDACGRPGGADAGLQGSLARIASVARTGPWSRTCEMGDRRASSARGCLGLVATGLPTMVVIRRSASIRRLATRLMSSSAHGFDQPVTPIDVIDAEILDLEPQQLVGDARRQFESRAHRRRSDSSWRWPAPRRSGPARPSRRNSSSITVERLADRLILGRRRCRRTPAPCWNG